MELECFYTGSQDKLIGIVIKGQRTILRWLECENSSLLKEMSKKLKEGDKLKVVVNSKSNLQKILSYKKIG